MRSIDIHTHLVPQCMWNTLNAGNEWYGMKYNNAEQTQLFIKEGRVRAVNDRTRQTPEQRLADMDKEGTDTQVVSIHTQVFGQSKSGFSSAPTGPMTWTSTGRYPGC